MPQLTLQALLPDRARADHWWMLREARLQSTSPMEYWVQQVLKQSLSDLAESPGEDEDVE
jgi:hypothetical protein